MDEKDLERLIEVQLKFQNAVAENLENNNKLFMSMDERIKTCHARINSQAKLNDALFDTIKTLRDRVSVLQEWKISKEGI